MKDQITIHINREQNALLQRLAKRYCSTVDELIEEAVYEYYAEERKTEQTGRSN